MRHLKCHPLFWVSVPIGSFNLYADSLHLGEELEGVPHPLAADARRLDATKGHVEVTNEPTVGPDRPHFQLSGDAVDSVDVRAPHTRAETKLNVVGSLYHL